jgi:VWFA-related protein
MSRVVMRKLLLQVNTVGELSLRGFWWLGGLLVLMAGALALAQNPPSAVGPGPVIKSEVRIVLVDVVVTRGKGEPVVGLRKEDFQVSEDGRPQTVSFFERHEPAPPKPVTLPAMPPNVFTNYPGAKTTDAVNVLLLDSLNTQARDQAYVRQQMIQYLANARPGARLAIFTLGSRLRMVRGVSADPAGFSAAVGDRQTGATPQANRQLATPMQVATDAQLMDGMRSPEAILAVKQFLSDEAGRYTGERIQITLQAFQQLARFLAPIPGRKNLMWFSGSFPISFFPTTGVRGTYPEQFQGDVKHTANLLTADQVAVYPIGARGLDVNTQYDADNVVEPSEQAELLQTADGERARSQIAMEMLAQDTGGKAFYNTNDLGSTLTEAIRDGASYYTLAYAPTNAQRNGKYRRIDVRVNGDYKLSYRRGYYAENAKDERTGKETSGNDPLLALMAFGMPDFSEVLYKVQALPVKPQPGPDAQRVGSNSELKGPVVRYGLDFAIAVQDVRLETAADGKRRGNVEVRLIAYDHDGKPLNMVSKKSGIVVVQQVYEELRRVGLQVHQEIDVPAGEVYLRTGVYDLNSNKAGTLGIALRHD